MRLIPASLFGRLTLILVTGLLAVQLTILWLHLAERQMLIGHGHQLADEMPSYFWLHLSLTLAAVITFALISVRLVTRPFQHLADAADAFGPDLDSAPLPESGPLETRRTAEAFNRMQLRLRALIAERSRALAAVSHDLRTPLTRLRLRAETLQDESLREQFNRDIDDMQAMVEATLDYLRGMREQEAPGNIDIDALLQSLVADAQALGQKIILDDSAVAPYPGRISALKRALANLLDNAVKYGGEARISLIDSRVDLRILIEDNGPGIAESELARVCEPYVRLESSRSRATGGVGLGLAIAREAALLHGGELRLENRSEGGLRALLILPRG
jgi:signal transduction histidine kinase